MNTVQTYTKTDHICSFHECYEPPVMRISVRGYMWDWLCMKHALELEKNLSAWSNRFKKEQQKAQK